MTWYKRLAFAATAMLLAVLAMGAVAVGADIYVHRKAERYSGVNIWGYRGPTVGRKRAGEHRIVVVGGSTTFGYGVEWNKAYPARLEAALGPSSRGGAPVTVVNLGFNAQGAHAFQYALKDYLWMNYDLAILADGYNDLGDFPNEYVGRRDSPVFRLTGYYPILQIFLQEKAMALRFGGNLDAAYWGSKTVFKPGLAARTTASALEAAAAVNKSLNAQLERLSKVPPVATTFADVHVQALGCAARWAPYCAAIDDGVRFVLDHHKKVLVVTQPFINDLHRDQQHEMRTMLASRFGNNPDVAYLDLGDSIVLPNPRLAYDGMHLTEEGNRIFAQAMVAPIARLMPEAFDPAPGTATQ